MPTFTLHLAQFYDKMNRIVRDGEMGGEPHFNHARVSVVTVYNLYESGVAREEIADDLEPLSTDDVQTAIDWAQRNEEVIEQCRIEREKEKQQQLSALD